MAVTEPDAPQEDTHAKEQFLYPIHSTSSQEATFPQVIFSANLQEFAQRVSIICALQGNGKLSPVEAFDMIKHLWSRLESSRSTLLD
ncbi:MAG: hypothetical protein HC921_14130 [Synechococcaceae cyanobacterium SM2_3_1]|nr:hypothetical protein [Synechococcaceae cyanobacterium SM2_3_1]